MTVQLWTITSTAGTVLCPSFQTPGATSHPKDNGWAWDAAKHKATPIPAVPDASLQIWNGTAWVEHSAKVEPVLVDQIKAEAERRRMLIYTANRGKMKVYGRKQQEVLDYRGLDTTGLLSLAAIVPAFGKLLAAAQKRKFRYAMADAARRGDTIDKAIARFEAGIDASEDQVAAIEATEQAGVAAIKAATTVTAKRAAYAALDWTWKA